MTALCAQTTTHLDETVRILGDLIAFPTVSVESNLDLIRYAARHLEALGADIKLFEDDTGAKANLFATIGPWVDGGIVLSGHSDVVPVAGQDWTSDPFTMIEKDGQLFGRGTCDMKGFIAAALAVAPNFAKAELSRPIHFCFTYDEESGCLGAQALMKDLKRLDIKPSVAIIGEPTEMRIIEGHKGCYEYTVDFTGLGGHGSLPDQGVNAVEYAVRYVSRLMVLREELKARAPEDSPFDPPWTTVSIGRLTGGIAHNVIPSACTLDWEMRPIRQADGIWVKEAMGRYIDDELRPAMKAVSAEADIVTTIVGEVEGLEPVPDSDAVRIFSELTGANRTDVVSFGTEAGLFQQLGISTIVCGPGSIEQAHKPDEFVSKDQLGQAVSMLQRLVHKLTQ